MKMSALHQFVHFLFFVFLRLRWKECSRYLEECLGSSKHLLELNRNTDFKTTEVAAKETHNYTIALNIEINKKWWGNFWLVVPVSSPFQTLQSVITWNSYSKQKSVMQLKDFPYRGGGCEVPNERKEDVASIRTWLKHQAHLPQITDEHILLFLHSNYFSVEKTKNTIESYFIVRAENPELFCNWDLSTLENAFKTYEFSPLPKTTPEGYKILLYRLKDTDPSKFIFQEALRAFFAYNDMRISEDGLVPGYVVLFDMKGCTLGHLARVSTVMYLVKTFMVYIQDCHPIRLKGVHVLNTASFMDKVLSLVKPLMQSELIKLLHLHSNLDTLKKFVSLELLPEEYGGDCKSGSYLHDEHYKLMKSDYSVWLKESELLTADLKKRPQKKKITDNNMQGSFRTLSID